MHVQDDDMRLHLKKAPLGRESIPDSLHLVICILQRFRENGSQIFVVFNDNAQVAHFPLLLAWISGRITLKLLPVPNWLLTVTCPSINSDNCLTMERPRPKPPYFRVAV